MASSTHSLPISPRASPAPTQDSLWFPAPFSPRGYDSYDDNWWWWDCDTICPFPLDDDPQTSGLQTGPKDKRNALLEFYPGTPWALECSDDHVNPDGPNWNSTSDHYEWENGIELEPNTFSHDFPESLESLCQPEFMSTMPMSDRGSSSTELGRAIQSSFSNNSPTMTTK
jgi:hypothetical protein